MHSSRRPAWLIVIGYTGAFLLLVWLVRYVLVGTRLESLLRGG